MLLRSMLVGDPIVEDCTVAAGCAHLLLFGFDSEGEG